MLFSLTVVALLLVPAAQALATPSMKVDITGPGSGEVINGTPTSGIWTGTPSMACSYNGTTTSGTCQNTPTEVEFDRYREWLVANPAPGSEFGGWVVQRGEEHNEAAFGCVDGSCEGFTEFCPATVKAVHGSQPMLECGFVSFAEGEANEFEVLATFCPAHAAIEEMTENKYWEESELLLVGCGTPPPTFPLTIHKTGTGTGTVTVDCEEGSGFVPCTSPIAEGTEVRLTATPDAGSELGGLSGTGSAAGCATSPCTFPINAASEATAEFPAIPLPKFPAKIVVEGEGEVVGTGITCTEGASAAECEEDFTEGTKAHLTATAGTGSHFAGWTTVAGSGAGTCSGTVASCETASLTQAVTLKATFAANSGGSVILIGTASALECPSGGITVEVEGDSSSKRAVCNGAPGTPGTPGAPGAAGERGEIGFPGPAGPAGPAGAGGAQGPQGAQGTQGSQGSQGAQGPAGKVTVTCKVTGSKKVTCTVKASKASASALRWTLRRHGHVLSHGHTKARQLEHVLNGLRHGHYVLDVNGRSTLINIR